MICLTYVSGTAVGLVITDGWITPRNATDHVMTVINGVPGADMQSAAAGSLEVGIVGTDDVLTIDGTHRDMALATTNRLAEGFNPNPDRLVNFLGSYRPSDMVFGELCGPMRDETEQWLKSAFDSDHGHGSLGPLEAARPTSHHSRR